MTDPQGVEPSAGRQLQRELEIRLLQQEAVAHMGQRALAGASLDELLEEIVRLVRTHLEVDVVGYLQCTDDPRWIKAIAGVGWPAELEHDGRLLPVAPGGLTERALAGREPVIIDDLPAIASASPVLVAAGVRSSLMVPIIGENPVGLIGAHSVPQRRFTAHDAAFLAAAANVVAVAHARLEAEALTRHRAYHDALTDLPNRFLLLDLVQEAISAARHRSTSTALVLIDLDGFKEVNDTLGHAVGDRLLKEVAVRMQEAATGIGTVARLGGDEFALLLPDVADSTQAVALTTELLQSLSLVPVIDGVPIPVDASAGVAIAPAHGDDPSLLLQRADLAMYRAKRGGGGVQAYGHAEDVRSRRRLALAGELRSAVELGQLALVFQPKVCTATGRVVGAEALVRWDHPTLGRLLPGDFLALAETTTTILSMSRWVVDAAVREAAAWRAEAPDLEIAVNCSARYLQSQDAASEVADALARHGLPARALIMEVTESALITEPVLARRTVSALREQGVRISIDDFGTGFASLAQLERLAADELKVDRGFVADLGSVPAKPQDASGALVRDAIVLGVIELGRRLGVSVVAEGVEDRAALRRLVELGCAVVQGYLLSHPVASADLLRLAHGAPFAELVGVVPAAQLG